jgi:hypothetical protein
LNRTRRRSLMPRAAGAEERVNAPT